MATDFSKRGSRFKAFKKAARAEQRRRDTPRGKGKAAGGKFLSQSERNTLEDNEIRIKELSIDSSLGYSGEAGDLHSANFKIRQGKNTLDPDDDTPRIRLTDFF